MKLLIMQSSTVLTQSLLITLIHLTKVIIITARKQDFNYIKYRTKHGMPVNVANQPL
jgi:hypothetical protein